MNHGLDKYKNRSIKNTVVLPKKQRETRHHKAFHFSIN
jgi:hypothetical protein